MNFSAIVLRRSLLAELLSILLIATAASGASFGEEKVEYRVVSYNIKRGFGNDGKTDLQRTADVIARMQADFVGLQEVDENAKRSGSVDQAKELGQQLGMEHAFAPFMNYDGGRYGLAILSKHPIEKIEVVELPTGNEPRVALAVQVRLPSGEPFLLVNIHLDWVSSDRFRFAQAQKLREFLDSVEMPYILMGDFNDQPGSRTVRLLSERALEAKKPVEDRMTYASDDPKIEIDFILAAPVKSWTISQTRVIDEPVASDHRPVLAVLKPHFE